MLAEYVQSGSEPAFRELVTRYLNLVYSAALRLVEGDTHRAEDVAQTVFADLARQARTLSPEVMLGGWLHRHTCFVAANTLRGERRRQSRERLAVEMNALQDHPEENLALMAPILDDAINQLGDADRTAILLRFFEQRDFRSVGEALGSNEDAARMRVTRALEKLHSLLKRRGVTTSAAALAITLSANAVQAAPIGLSVAITAAGALAGTINAATLATTTTMNWINIKSVAAIVVAALAAGTGTYLVQQRDVTRLRNEHLSLVAQQERLISERDTALSTATANNNELEGLRKDRSELLRLRGAVGRLHAQSQELEKLQEANRQLATALAKSGQSSQVPDAGAEVDVQRQAAIAKMNDAKLLVLSLLMYSSDHQDQLPADFSQTSNYWSTAGQHLPETGHFELVIQGSLTSLTNPATTATTIAVRENEASLVNGKWFKVYGFADGHAEFKSEPPEGFAAWEKQHIIASLPARQ